jgi:hypothetical protein
MTSTIDNDRRGERRSRRSTKSGKDAPLRARTEPSSLREFLAMTVKGIRLTLALAIIVAFELGDSCL